MSFSLSSSFNRDRQMTRAFYRAVIISLGIHLLVVGTTAALSGLNRKPRVTLPTIGVKFYSPPAGGKKSGGTPPKPPAAVTKPQPSQKEKVLPPAQPPKPETKPPEPKKETKPEEKKEPKPPEPKKEEKPAETKKEIAKNTAATKETKPAEKKETKPEEKKAEEKKSEPAPAEEKPEPPPAKPPDPETLSSDLIRELESEEEELEASSPPGRGDSEFEGDMSALQGDPRFRGYYGKAVMMLKEVWRLPPSVPLNQGLHVDVIIIVDREGMVLEYEIKARSGHATLDRSVETMLEQLKQLPPPPPELASNDRVRLPFRFMPGAE